MMQETVLKQLLNVNDGQSRGTGFLARMLFAAPNTTMGTRFYQPPPLHDRSMDAFSARIHQLLDMKLPVKDGTMELEPTTLTLSPEAYALWIEYYNEVEARIGKLGEYETVKDFASKSAENAARLAGNFHVFSYGITGTIVLDTMHQAIEVARWHLNETRRIFMVLEQPDDVQLAQTLLDWIEAKSLTILNLKELLQYGPYKLRNPAKRDAALRKLVEHHYLIETKENGRILYQVCTVR